MRPGIQTEKTAPAGVTRRVAVRAALAAGVGACLDGQTKPEEYEVVVFGATPAGVMASVAASRVGARVALVEANAWVGGNFYAGICHAEESAADRLRLIGGLSQEFYQRASPPAKRQGNVPQWLPQEAQNALREMLSRANVSVRLGAALDAVRAARGRIRALALGDGSELRGKIFVDASGEGDLLAAAGVPCALGREPAIRYGETLAGVLPAAQVTAISPVDERGILPGLLQGTAGNPQSGDARVASSQLRAVLTASPEIRVPLQAPAGYDPRSYELLGRCAAVGLVKGIEDLFEWKPLGGNRVAVAESARAVFSLGLPEAAMSYATASAEERAQIYRLHRDHTHGLLWFLRTDQRVPATIRDAVRDYGLCADLWPETGHWPPAFEVREARRMMGEVILNQRDLEERRQKTDSIGLAIHDLRGPVVGRYAVGRDAFREEGAFRRKLPVFEIPWLALTPRRLHCDNLLAPVCLSASHVAWHALRAEQTRMALGEAAGIAAALAADAGKAVLDLDAKILQAKLRRVGLPIDLRPEAR